MSTAKLLLLVLTFAATTLHAGDTTQTSSFKRLYAGFSFMPAATYRYLRVHHATEDLSKADLKNLIMDPRNKREHPDFGFAFGGRFGVNVTRFFSVETGVDYYLHRYTYKSERLTFASDFNSNFEDTNTVDRRFRYTENYHYLHFPVALNFTIGKKKARAAISAGAHLQWLVGKTLTSRYIENGEVIRKKTGSDILYAGNKFNLFPFFAAGAHYQINELMFLRLMATAQMQALKNSDTPIVEHLWSAGISASLYFGFLRGK